MRAYQEAGYSPWTVELVEGHGTSTKVGDVAGFQGLVQAFGGNQKHGTQWCALGSIKSQIGGSNFHLTVEEYAGSGNKAGRFRTVPSELILISADTPQTLLTTCRTIMEDAPKTPTLAEVARSSQETFDPAHCARLAIVATSRESLGQKLLQVIQQIEHQPEAESSSSPAIRYTYVGPQPGKVAFLFPGQGSQFLNMGAGLAIHSAAP